MARERRRGGGDDGSTDRWLGTYGDAITLLMAFFVMLYAVSQVDQQKFEAFVRGLAVPFGNTAGQGLLDSGPNVVGDGGADTVRADARTGDVMVPPPGIDPPVAVRHDEGDDREGDDREGEADEGDAQLDQIRRHIIDELRGHGLPTEVTEFHSDERGLVVTIASDDVLFALGSADISALGSRIIATVGEVLAGYPNGVHVEGHTDDTPLDRNGYTNWNLSTDRAVSVLSLLHERQGIAPERLSAVGYGEFRPRYPNDTAAHRAHNRRVDILIVRQGGTIDG